MKRPAKISVHFGVGGKIDLLRVFLVFILTGLGSAVGTWVGGYEIFKNLVGYSIYSTYHRKHCQCLKKRLQSAPSLTTRQKQFLKGLAHPLSPFVQIGKEELSSGVLQTIRTELNNHELIKVKIGSNCGLEKHSSAKAIAEQDGECLWFN